MLKVEVVPVGQLRENTVILKNEDTKEALFVDPGAEGEKLENFVDGYKVVGILATHGHLDHVGQVGYLKDRFNVPFMMNKKDEFLINNEIFPGFSMLIGATPCPKPDKLLKEGDIVKLGDIDIHVIETPGHTPGGLSFYIPSYKLLIAGDTLFKGSVGRTDLPGGDPAQLKASLEKLMNLPEDTKVICGHYEDTTIGEEKRSNPYITGKFKVDLW